MKELKLQERNFEVVVDGKKQKYKVIRPTFAIGNRADLIYKKAFGDALKDGLLTAFQMQDVMSKIEYFSGSSAEVLEIDKEIDEAAEKLKNLTREDEEEATPLVMRMKELRLKKTLALFKVNSIYDNSAESYAENMRNQFYAAMLTRTKDGKKVWNSYEDFQRDAGTALCAEAVTNVMLFNAQIGDNYEMSHEENKWLLENNYIDEDGNVIERESKDTEDDSDDKKEDDAEEQEVKPLDKKEEEAAEKDEPVAEKEEKKPDVAIKEDIKVKKGVLNSKEGPPVVTDVKKIKRE